MTKENFTAARISSYSWKGGSQTIYKDAKVAGLGLRITKAGSRAFIFERRVHGNTRRFTIGDPGTWTIDKARAEASRLGTLIDQGIDPREVDAEARAAHRARAAAEAAKAMTVGAAWTIYLEERRPHWGERHYQDHIKKAQPGGVPSVRGTRGKGVTIAGPLFPLMSLRLCDLLPAVVEAWAESEATARPTSARLAWRLLKSFLAWCAEKPEFAAVVVSKAASTKKARTLLGKAGSREDVLQREQLAGWFSEVRKLPNRAVSAYLQTVLLTGARPGEILEMVWADIDFKWRKMTIRDKVDGVRTIPLTPYVAAILNSLPRRANYVFAGAESKLSKPIKPLSKPHKLHEEAYKSAGVDHLTLNGLRRSFRTLTEWIEIPIGVVYQIMGHKPSATAEKHYTVRPIDLLRLHHETIEAWFLTQANISFPVTIMPVHEVAI
jgi:integrase